MAGPLYDVLPRGEAGSDGLLARFLDYVSDLKLTLYPAQEDAVLALFEGKNVILNTPTGSGKSLVASALHFAALANGRRSVYTCPIKALVNEKWMALCRELGPENVGLSTGDATVNREAPVLCCTAEVLADSARVVRSLTLCTREEKNAVGAAIAGFRFTSPYGPTVRKWLKQGIGVHHAGLLPKYRVLLEQLAQAGLLKVICGTDTLGVGINVPIRSVRFSPI